MNFDAFQKVYADVCRACLRFWTPEMQTEMARHCVSWSPENFNFTSYFELSALRAYYAYLAIVRHVGETGHICDVGGFGGVFPIVLKRLGYTVTMTEALKYYSKSFDPLFDFVRQEGVEIYDYDPFEDAPTLDVAADCLTCMAVLEHYPHSPAQFIQHIKQLVRHDGVLYFEVPNIAYWPKRYALFFKGETPLVNIAQIYASATPFIGHHHEYTGAELKQLAAMAELTVLEERAFNYSNQSRLSAREKFGHLRRLNLKPLLDEWIMNRYPNMRECLAVTCKNGGIHG